MNQLTKRRIVVTVVGLAILAAGYFGNQAIAGQKAEPPKRPTVRQIKTVETAPLEVGPIATELDIQGRLQAYNKIALFSEVGGTVRATGKPFKVGTYFAKGAVLLRIDNEEQRLSLQAQKANLMTSIAQVMPDLKIDYPESFGVWQAYLNDFKVDGELPELPEVSDRSAQLFLSGRNLFSQYYTIKSAEDRLRKFTLYAPFSGVLTSTAIDQGAVVRANQQIGELMANGYYELVATVPLSQLNYLRTGGKVQLYSEDLDGSWSGKVNRISDQIDPGSQTVDVYIGVRGKNLREGMYLRGTAEAQTLKNVAEIDRDLLIDEAGVYVVESDSILRLQPVTVEKFSKESVIISGLPAGTPLLTSDVAGAFDGMIVKRKPAPVTKK